jgi:hypothetical protein
MYNNGFVRGEHNPVAVFWKIKDGKTPDIAGLWNKIRLKLWTQGKQEQPIQRSKILTFKEPKNRFKGINSASYVAWRAGTTTLFPLGS